MISVLDSKRKEVIALNSRLYELRKSLKLTQREMGETLGLKDSAISKIEKGDNILTEQNMKALCRAFNVNYDWLKYGEGEMFENLPESLLDEVSKQFNLDDLDRELILGYLRLPEAERKVLKNYVKNILGK